MANFNLIGLYNIIPNHESVLLAARFHGYDWLINQDGKYTENIDPESIRNLYLFELQAFGSYSPSELLEIQQNNQSPYLEFYLDSTGEHYLEEEVAIKIASRRVCFFVHFVDTSQPFLIKGQQIVLPPPSQLPSRLEPFTHYVPVD